MLKNPESRATLLLSLIFLLGCTTAEPESDVPRLVAFTNVNVVPMDTERVLRDQTVLVQDGMITAVEPTGTVEIPPGALHVDGRGSYLLPGLVDMHIHLRSEHELLSYLAYGITTVVNLSGATSDAPDLLRTRARLAEGDLIGPTLYTTGPSLDGDPPIFAAVSTVVTTPEEAERAVVAQVEAGYDFIKVYNGVQPDVLRAIVAAAHARGKVVFGHIPRPDDRGREGALQRALNAGLDVIAHGEEYFFTFFYAGADSLLDRGEVPWRDAALIPEAVRLTREAGAAVIPNLSFVAMTRFQLDSLDTVLADPETRYLSSEVIEMWELYNPTRRSDLDRFDLRERAKYAFVQSLTKALHDAGVPLLLGSDASLPGLFPGKSAHVELRELVEAGLTPYEALATGTRNAGRFIHEYVPSAQPFGMIAPGYRADLLLVRGNPLVDIYNAADIEGVMVRGQWFPSAELERRRDEIAGPIAINRQSIAAVLAEIIEEEGVEAAVQQYRTILETDPSSYQLGESQLNRLGYTLLSQDKPNEALAVFELNVSAFPESANAYDSLGETLEAAGRTEEAIAAYEQALARDPDGNIGRNAREQIEQLRTE